MSDYTIEIERTSAEEAQREYPVLFRTYQKFFPELSEVAIALMVDIATGVCHECWTSPRSCQCWNDE